ncbi:MAG TPA: polymorphic toxin-type HINT domain-containing protein [Candidatus Limnocylindrales bacterium]
MRRTLAFAVSAVMLAVFAEALPAAARPYKPAGAQTEPTVAGSWLVTGPVRPEPMPRFKVEPAVWPEAATVEVAVPDAAANRLGLGGPQRVPGLPLTVEAAAVGGTITVQSLGRNETGLLMRVSSGTARSVALSFDYKGFRHAYGGDWASRLALYADGKKVASVNDHAKGTVAATVQIEGSALVALAAGGGGAGGDYKATSLSPSATWNAGGNSGDFGWNYPLRMPPALNGPAPGIEFAYSSSGVDGRMAATNNQASWIGEGFEWNPGHIERRYNVCAEDMGSGANNSEKTGDLCWETDNASLAMSGHAGELIKDGSHPNRWHLRSDDGTIVERKTGGPNGARDGEWWTVTTPDGTQYWFGGRSGSASTLTVPVFGNHNGEPCHATAFADSFCTQGYKWFLDHVVDRNGNTMSYAYTKETNKYGRNNKAEDDTVYDRDGYLKQIDYGTRTGSTGNAPMRVLFGVADRCFTDCGENANWLDAPLDQECTKDTCEFSQNSPTFWTKRRLSTVKTQVWSGLTHKDVEQWTLHHSFPSSDQPGLWLDRISHTGLVGTSKSVPDITFTGEAKPNRVDTNNDQYPAMNRYRMKTITSETGGKLDLTYTAPDCVSGTRVPDKNNLQLNTLRCYPVRWQPEGQTSPITDFFHKYLISDVVEADLSGSSSRVLNHYDYLGAPAWHYTDDDGFIKKDYKTWSVWRGYAAVQTVKGDPGEQTREERRYFRGMHGDKMPSGTRSVQLPAIGVGNVPAANDEDAFSGMVREEITYSGPGGAEVSASAHQPWQSTPTASRTVNGFTVHARFSEVTVDHTRTVLDRGRGHRTTTQTKVFDAYGMEVRTEDQGEDGKTGDEQCTLTDYARNTGANLLDRVSRKRTFAVDCTKAQGAGLTDADVIGDTRTSYDGLAWNAAPTAGMPTKVEILNAYNNGSPAYLTESRKTYDAHGRVFEEWDLRNAKTTTTYTPATGAPVTASTKTSPLGWVKSSVIEPAWGLPLSTTDANGRKVSLAYDPFGRLTSVWLAGRDGAQSPSIKYDYAIRNNAPTVVTTQRLNAAGGYITSYQFYDNLYRSRQTQEADGTGNGSKTVVTDTFYDSAGRAFKTHDSYLAPVSPSTNLFVPSGNIPSVKVRTFDGAGRETAVITKVNAPPASPGGTEKWRTTTAYGGDRNNVTPPRGGTATSTVTDAMTNKVELRQYHAGVAAGSDTGFDRTAYSYNRKGQLERFTDAGGNQWTYEYDARGRQVRSVDPDKGSTTTVFNDAGDVVSTTDGRGVTIAYTYDAAGRKTSLRDGSPTGPKRSEWVYDQLANGTFVHGQLVKTIRYDGSAQYVKEHLGYTVDYKPTSVKFTVPSSETGLAGSYSYVYTYHQDGSNATTRLPAMGDLGLETLTHGYNSLGKASTLDTSLGATLVTGTEYTSYGELAAINLRHNAGPRADIVRTYETDTRRLAQIWTTKASNPTTVADVRYSYDEMGNVAKVSDLTSSDHQCFTTDNLKRLKDAWTPANGDCLAAPSTGALGGPAKYWHTYDFDATGNRTRLVEHSGTGDATTNYSVAGHRLNSAGGNTFTYDASGNMLTRPAPGGGTQTLTWDAEGHLATSADSTGTTSFIYDVDGNRLVRKDPTGKTLYLPGQELRYSNAGGVKTCTRYYTHADTAVAVRTAAGVVWLSGDHHGTAQIAVNAVSQAVATRRETPYGLTRSSSGTWLSAMDKGFVGGTKDNTGLTHLGAREYDPLIGRFISVDPVIDTADPQQMHGYTYGNNAPITASDPDGLWPKIFDNAVNSVKNAVSSAASSVASATKAVGTWVYDNAGTISTVLAVAAVACAIIPPLQAAAPFLGAAATAVGAIETYKTCKQGVGLDCAMGLAELVPGGRAIGAAGKGLKYADEALDAANNKKALPGKPNKLDCHSFAPGTPVLMADGTRKAIGEVEVGDKVTATDPESGQTEAGEVTTLHANVDRDLTDVTVTTGGESVHTLETTWNHPFWSVTRDSWVQASELLPGEELRNADGTTVTVTAVRNHVGESSMRDLTVAGFSTYYVLAGEQPVLVHNNDPTACPIPGHKGDPIEFRDAPPGCDCPKYYDPNRKSGPGGQRVDEGDTVADKERTVKERRTQTEAPVRVVKDVVKKIDSGDPITAGVIGAAAVVTAFVRWLRRIFKWF